MAASRPQDIRNIVLLGHGGAGKTTLGEALLHAAKVTGRLGSVDEGTSQLDFTDIEKERGHSVDPAMAHFDHDGVTINLIDAPGYPDFIGGAISALAGADVAVAVISATAGIEVNTRRLFKAAQDYGMPIAIVVNKIDAENVRLDNLLKEIAESLGSVCKPMNLPSGGGKSLIDCFVSESGQADVCDPAGAHTQLIESVIESDEVLMEAYLGGEKIPPGKLSAAFASAMVAGTLIPILFTSARGEVGVREFADAMAKFFPSPAQVKPRPVREDTAADAAEVPISADPAKPFVGQAFRIATDPFVGKLAWIRVLQGTVQPDTAFVLRDQKRPTKIGHLFKVQGKETAEIKQAIAGDIIALAKIEEIQFGDVLHSEVKPMYRASPPMPTPMYSLAVSPKSRGDEQKISGALGKLAEEDGTFLATRDSQTNETVISGIGDLHLRIMLTKMKQRFNLEVDTKPPKIPYRETISIKAEGHYRHKKQTGGAGQFGEVYLRVEPMDRGAGHEFVNDLYGESVPRQFLPAIEKGINDVLQAGALAGYPIQDIRVSVYDGKSHPVDSKEVAFRTAGKYALIDAIGKAKPVILEPIVNLEVTVPSGYVGDIAGDLSGRRGRILGQDTLPGGQSTLRAQAPLAEVTQYNSQLRSVTGGQGSYTMEFSHYEPVPSHIQQQIIAAATKAREEERER
jgi:elongation factor G